MAGNPFLSFVNRVGEGLNDFRALVDKVLGRIIAGVGHLAGLFTDRGEDISLALEFDGGGGRFEQRDIISLPSGESSRHQRELHRGIHRQIDVGSQAVFTQNVFQRHQRDPALASADQIAAPQLLKGEAALRRGLASDEECAVPFGQLGKNDRIVSPALLHDVDGRLRAGKADIHLPREHRRHHLVGALTGDQLYLKPFLGKKALGDRSVLRRVENRAGHLADGELCQLLGLLGFGAAPCK